MKAAGKKKSLTRKGRQFRLADLSIETWQSRRKWHNIFNSLKEKNMQPKIKHPFLILKNAFYKIQHPFLTKTMNKVGIEGIYLNIIKAMYERPKPNIFNGKKLRAFPQWSGTRQGYPLSTLLFYIGLDVLASAIRQQQQYK